MLTLWLINMVNIFVRGCFRQYAVKALFQIVRILFIIVGIINNKLI